ncbi:HAMP domain-containing histidine kinase [Patescibacteria group bacterium]|nr:MAG: HAMP domain-containing histidine kinase [Patescibacteria group bacterium]
MQKIWERVKHDFNIKQQADELGLKVWQAPSLLFILMGLIIVVMMAVDFYVSRRYASPEVLVISEALVVSVILTIGTFIIQSIEDVAHANKTRSEFVSIASHQLKTPLAEANWQIELLLSMYQHGLSDRQLEIVSTVSSSLRKMTKLVSDLLDVARIEQGRFVLLRESVDITKLVDQVVLDYNKLAMARGAQLSVTHGAAVPLVSGDSRRLKMVLDNLLSNAIKYIERNGKILLEIETEERQVVVRVADNGSGIPAEQQDKVFQKFFRSTNVIRSQTEGTGLGLYIAKNIVEQSGGKMWFQSQEGKGSTFFFSLPIE